MALAEDTLTLDQRTDVAAAVAELDGMTIQELRQRHIEVFGETTTSRQRSWLVRRLAWKIQEQIEGGLSDRVRARAAELAKGMLFRERRPSDHHSTAKSSATKVVSLDQISRDHLSPGTILRREWKGRTISAVVQQNGFEHEGTLYRSLSALATAVTGTKWNGYAFFGLRKKKKEN